MNILAIDTSCDETAAAVISDGKIISNVVWSQIKLHKSYGGVMPSVAKRAHEEHLPETIHKSLSQAQITIESIDTIAVTAGPGLAIALEVGLRHAKQLAEKHQKKLIAVNHIEGHVLSALSPHTRFPALAVVVSGKHTELIYIPEIGQYQIVAQTADDALGEALDKAARMLGLGYPGGAILEKMAKLGNLKTYPLPLPLLGRENQNMFSYSGVKTAMYRLVESLQPLDKQKIYDLAASFQYTAFAHLVRVLRHSMANYSVHNLLIGGGVAANSELRQQMRKLAKEFGMTASFPSNKRLCGDNAGMIGMAAHFKATRGEFADPKNLDRLPRWRINQ